MEEDRKGADSPTAVKAEEKSKGADPLNARADTVRELYAYFAQKRSIALLVLISVLLVISLILVVAEAIQFLAPFIYTIF